MIQPPSSKGLPLKPTTTKQPQALPTTSRAFPDGTSQPPAGKTYLMTAGQHQTRAKVLRQHQPNSRAAALHELAAKLKSASH